jgi:hypothetical protein
VEQAAVVAEAGLILVPELVLLAQAELVALEAQDRLQQLQAHLLLMLAVAAVVLLRLPVGRAVLVVEEQGA